MPDKQTALVLPKGATASSEPQTFAGIPGVYAPGQPVSLEETGISEERAKEIAKDDNVPLKLAQAAPSSDELPIAGRHFDEKKLEPGEAVPMLAPGAPVASALEGHDPDGTPLGTPAESTIAAEEVKAESK